MLLRAAGDLEVFERALQLQGLRTLAAVGAFWGHQQIGDLLSYLRALANPLDEARALLGARLAAWQAARVTAWRCSRARGACRSAGRLGDGARSRRRGAGR